MYYPNVKEGIFVERVNRFIANVYINDKLETCHVKNTGRCKEILVNDSKVLVQEFDSNSRKTKFDLISVYKGRKLINIDSQIPNKMFGEFLNSSCLFKDINYFKSEVTFGNSRFDFYIEYQNKKAFIEVKGVTLERDGVVLFPDAPTSRGVKHLKELIRAKREGYEAYVIFIVQMEDVKYFTPNYEMHKEFGEALSFCKDEGVGVLAFDSVVSKNEIYIKGKVDVVI